MGIPDHLTCLLQNLYAGQEATELDKEQWSGSKLGNEYIMYPWLEDPPDDYVLGRTKFPHLSRL